MLGDPAGTLLGRLLAGVTAQGGVVVVEGLALIKNVGQGLPRGDGQAAVGIAGDALFDGLQRYVQEDHRPQRGQMCHGLRPVDGAAARGDDRALDADGAQDHGFQIQEGFLAQGVGDALQAVGVQGFHKIVAVHEGPAQGLGQGHAHSGFSRAGHADEDHTGTGGRRGQQMFWRGHAVSLVIMK